MTKPNETPVTKPKPTPKPPGEHIAFRAPPGTVAKIDAEARALQSAHPGLTVTRSDALRAVVLRGLARGRGVAPDVEV